MLVKPLEIREVFVIHGARLADDRGYFVESYSKRSFEKLGVTREFVQDNEALSTRAGTLRGLHFQTAPDAQAKLVRVIRGSIFDVAVDLREASSSYGRWCGTTLAADAWAQTLFIPVGFAHGYVTLEPDTLVAYKVDAFYNKSAEAGIRWNDPDLGIEWPIDKGKLTISDKDAGLPLLRDAATLFRF